MTSLHNEYQKPILVTGSHRSGSTWVGRMLANSDSVGYIFEPFSLLYCRESHRANFEHWFTYVCEENEHLYTHALEEMLRFHYPLIANLRDSKDWKTRAKVSLQCFTFLKYRSQDRRPLVKDPIALFSAEWFDSRFDSDVVILIRHPAAFAGSLKKLNWRHDFSDFLQQERLMNDHLLPFREEILDATKHRMDIVDEASLLWNIIQYRISNYRKAHPDWIFVRHEDLSRDPEGGFRSLYAKLGLEYGKRQEKNISAHSFSNVDNPARSNMDISANHIKRNSLKNLDSWKERLTSQEIQRIKSKVQTISSEWYSESEW